MSKTINIGYDIPNYRVIFTYQNHEYKEVWECRPFDTLNTMINIADYMYRTYGYEISFTIN